MTKTRFRILSLLLVFAILISVVPTFSFAVAEGAKLIALDSDALTDENIYKYHDVNIVRKCGVLVDEQDTLPLSPSGETKVPKDSSTWQPVYGNDMPGAACYLRLDRYYFITEIYLFDSNGSPLLTIETGEPFQWDYQAGVKLDRYRSWRSVRFDQPVSTRFVRFSSEDSNSGISEIGLYGYPDDSRTVPPPYTPPTIESGIVTADKAFGVNAFVDDPLQVSKVAGTIREFHNVSFTFQDGLNYFAPSVNNSWNFDEYYRSLVEEGIDVLPCIQGTTEYISGSFEDFSGNEKPLPQGADPQDPFSYALHASIMFNYAARYGSTKVDTSRLSLGANQTPKSGLGYITYYENFNEQNKDWEGAKSYFTPYQFAAMCSADFDGHEGKMGKDYGLVNADPNAKLVMGGLVGRNVLDYIKAMKFWFEHNRQDKRFVPSVINLHRYVTTSCPENTSFAAEMEELRAYVDENLPGVEIWVTEFGPEIPESEIADVKSEEYLEAKGNATVRQFLLGYAKGIERMTMFMLRDTSWGVYANDGLVTEKGLWETKPSWHYVFGTREALKNTVFDGVVRQDDTMIIYRFKDLTQAGKSVYCLWSPTKDGSRIENYVFDIGNKKSAYLTTLQHGYAQGVKTKLPLSGNNVTFTVSERPVFLTLYDKENVRIPPTKERIPIESITGDPTLLKRIEVMFDEQSLTPFSPTLRLENEFADYEQDPDYIEKVPNKPELSRFPTTAIIDFGKEYVITDVAFYDSFSTGNIILYSLTPQGTWESILTYPLNYFNTWKVLECKKLLKTRFLKIEKYSLAVCREMALYGYAAY